MYHQINELLGENTGNILVVTILILFAISVIGTVLTSISATDLKIAGNQRAYTQALTTAEAGLNEAIHRFSIPNPTVVTVGGWTGNAAIRDTEPYDPDWTARIFLTSPAAAPPSNGSILSTGTLQDPGQNYMPYSQAEGTEGVLTIQHKWMDLNADGVRDANEIIRYDPGLIPPENFTSGFPVEIVSVTGWSGNASRTIEAEVTRKQLSARTLGALYHDAGEFEIESNGLRVCGFNHDAAMPVWLAPMDCFAWHVGSGDLAGIAGTGGEMELEGGTVTGVPSINNSNSNPFYSLAEVLSITASELNQLLASADHTSITNPLDGVTYIDGNATVSSNTVGSGILYVTGNLQVQANFEFRGLVYVEGRVTRGSLWVLGTVITGAGEIEMESGSITVLYSEDALRLNLSDAMPAMLLSWLEK